MSALLLTLLILFFPLIFWLWMFFAMARNPNIAMNVKIIWFIAFIIFNIFTAIYYYISEHSKKPLTPA